MKPKIPFRGLLCLAVFALLMPSLRAQMRLQDLKVPAYTWGGTAGSAAVNPRDVNEIFVMSAVGGLYQTRNGGTTWRRVESFPGLTGGWVKFCPSDPEILIATCGYDTKTDRHIGVWRSTDHGFSWQKPGPDIYAPDARCPDRCGAAGICWVPGSNTVYVATDCGLIRSDNNGRDWVEVPVDPASSGGDDYWDRWRARPDRLFSVLAMDANHVLTGGESGQYYMHDGRTWNKCADNVPSFYCPGALSYVPQNSRFVFRADYNTGWLMYSTDQGITWTPFEPEAYAFVRAHPDYQFGADGPEMWLTYSTDGGMSWNRFDGKNRGAGNVAPSTRVAASSRGPGFFELYFGNGTWLYKATLSLDPATWPHAAFDGITLPHADPQDLVFHPTTGRPYFLVGDWGMARTTDDGLSWYGLGNGAAGYNALEIFGLEVQEVNDAGFHRDVNFVTWHNGSWSSTDDALHWTEKWPVEGNHITGNGPAINGASNVRTSIRPWGGNPTERGRGLDQLMPDGNVPRNADWWRTITFYRDPASGTDYTLITSVDGSGNTYYDKKAPSASSWTEIMRDGSTFPYSYPVYATMAGEVRGYFVGSDGRLRQLRNVNASPSITMLAGTGLGEIAFAPNVPGKAVFAVKPDDDRIMLASDRTCMCMKKSTDGGSTWSPMNTLTSMILSDGAYYYNLSPSISQVYEIVFDPFHPTTVAIGTHENGVFISEDAGETWWPVPYSDDLPRVSEMHFGSDGSLWIGTAGRGLWKYYNRFLFRVPEDILYQCEDCVIDPSTGARVPIGIIGDPEICPACNYVFNLMGRIISYKYDKASNRMTIVTTHPQSLYVYAGKKSTMDFEVVQGTYKPLNIKMQYPQPAVEGLVISDGVVKAEIRDKGELFTFSDKALRQALTGKLESLKPYTAPMIPAGKYSLDAVRKGKGVLQLAVKGAPELKQGGRLDLYGRTFRPSGVNYKGEVRFYADGILLPGSGFTDTKGNLKYSCDLRLPPGTYTLTALYQGETQMEKAEMLISIGNADGEKEREGKK